MEYFVHTSDFADGQDCVLVDAFDAIEDARAAAAAGDPEKFYFVSDIYGGEY